MRIFAKCLSSIENFYFWQARFSTCVTRTFSSIYVSLFFFFFVIFRGRWSFVCVCVSYGKCQAVLCLNFDLPYTPIFACKRGQLRSLSSALSLSLFSSKRRIGFPQLLYQFRWRTKAKLGVCAIWQFRHVALGSTQSDVTSYTLVYSTAISHRSPVN